MVIRKPLSTKKTSTPKGLFGKRIVNLIYRQPVEGNHQEYTYPPDRVELLNKDHGYTIHPEAAKKVYRPFWWI